MPILRQLLPNSDKRRNARYSHSSQGLIKGGDHSNGSPPHPSVGEVESDQSPASSSPVSTLERNGGPKFEVDSEIKSSPTSSIASRLGRMSLTADNEQGAEDSRSARRSRCSRQWEAKHHSMLTLGNPAALGYSCDIEGGSPKSRT